MSEVIAALNNNRERGSLIGYLPVGFPDLETSIEAAVALVRGGVDILELGLPYSDPVMDGPVIQEATITALAAGFKTQDLFTAIREIKKQVDVPVLVMSYWNLVLQQGISDFARRLKAAGGAGLITPDLIPDEAQEWIRVADELQLDRVFLASQTSTDERLATITRLSRGFVYTVSTMGVTGTRADIDKAARQLAARLRSVGANEVCVGIGISTADQVAEVLGYADGAIVGSAFVRALKEGGPEAVFQVAKELSEGKRQAGF